MSSVREDMQPVNHRVIDKLKPAIQKMLRDMAVQYVEWRETSVIFHYLDLNVSIEIKSKRNHENQGSRIKNGAAGMDGRNGDEVQPLAGRVSGV